MTDPGIKITAYQTAPLGLNVQDTDVRREGEGIKVHFITDRPVGAHVVLSPEVADRLAQQLRAILGG